jgi:hypothetical protein
MNAKQKTVIGIALAVIVGMGVYPPWRFCGLRYGWLLSPLEVPEKCFSTTFELATEFELATDRLFLQWGVVLLLAVGLVFAFKGPKALQPLKDYQGATFRFTKYAAPSEKWKSDHCAGCWAKFAEYDGQDILHEGYVATVDYNETPDDSQPFVDGTTLIFVCARCFNKCRGPLDFRVESPSTLEAV